MSRESERDAGGKAICDSFAETFQGGGWADPITWDDHNEAGRERFRKAYDAALLSSGFGRREDEKAARRAGQDYAYEEVAEYIDALGDERSREIAALVRSRKTPLPPTAEGGEG